jgi:hypothetical protein
MTGPVCALSGAAVLSCWEAGAGRSPVDRALMLLGHALAASDSRDLEAWPVGRRDAMLLEVRAATFGTAVAATTACPCCAAELEVALNLADLRASHGAAGAELELAVGEDLTVRFRLPSSADLRAAAAAGSWEQGRRVVAERCLVEARRSGRPLPAAALPEVAVAAMGTEVARHDPQSDVRLEVACEVCGHRWQARFDIADYLWREVAAEARRLLADVHTLATGYGWSEADILAMSGQRRRLYLELVVA